MHGNTDPHDFVMPLFLLELGWPYGHVPKTKMLVSSSGVRTRAHSELGLPHPKDRLVILFLARMALHAREVRFRVTEIAKLFGLGWRKQECLDRLDRVLRCCIELPGDGEWLPFRIVDWYDPDPTTGEVTIMFSSEFRLAADDGVPYSLRELCGTLAAIAATEFYLMMLKFLYREKYRKSWAPYDRLPSAQSAGKIRQQMEERLSIVKAAWPEMPFRLQSRGVSLTCSKADFERFRFGRDPEEHANEMRAEIESRSRQEFNEYLATLPPWQRSKLHRFYLLDYMYPQVRDGGVGAFLGSPSADKVLERVRPELARQRMVERIIKPPTRTQEASDSSPTGETRTAPADVSAVANDAGDSEHIHTTSGAASTATEEPDTGVKPSTNIESTTIRSRIALAVSSRVRRIVRGISASMLDRVKAMGTIKRADVSARSSTVSGKPP